MRIALIADTFFPLRTSGAVQLADLATEFVKQGHEITVIVASPEIDQGWYLEILDNINVLRLKTPKTHGVGHLQRAIGELLMPFAMLLNFKRSPLSGQCWDGIVWYSPSIFFGPIIAYLKRQSRCRSYLIIRDIFPEWALDMGLIKPGLVYRFFKLIANYQYSVADIIGIQSPGNSVYFESWRQRYPDRKLEVLHNWLSDRPVVKCPIDLAQTVLRGRKIFVYAGNMGVAQGIDTLVDLARAMKGDALVGFVFVGRGSEAKRIQSVIDRECLVNTLFFDEIDPAEIHGLYAQCHIGLVALDKRHKSHNIPGKFLSYMLAGLPVLASVNPDNDLVEIIEREGIGLASTDGSTNNLALFAKKLIDSELNPLEVHAKCRKLAESMFSSTNAVKQIVAALTP